MNGFPLSRAVLPVAWRLMTELFRRHGAKNDLRILHCHPGISVAGQLWLLVNPSRDSVSTCTRVSLNLGGTTGAYAIEVGWKEIASGDFLESALAGDLLTTVETIERALGWKPPHSLPPSTPTVLAMRLITELLTTSCLDLQPCEVEMAWLDWSGGCEVLPWAKQFLAHAEDKSVLPDGDTQTSQSDFFRVSGLLRVAPALTDRPSDKGWVFDLVGGTATWMDGKALGRHLDIRKHYAMSHRRIEPLTAQLLIKLRQGGKQ